MLRSKVLHTPITDKVHRTRTYEIVSLRQDRKDMIAQLVTSLDSLLDEKFNGTIILNVSNGGIANIQAKEVSKMPLKYMLTR